MRRRDTYGCSLKGRTLSGAATETTEVGVGGHSLDKLGRQGHCLEIISGCGTRTQGLTDSIYF